MIRIDSIPVSRLLLDPENPRFAGTSDTQAEEIVRMFRQEQDTLVTLAKHMIANGADPLTALAVVEIPGEPRLYRALEGNRRLTVLKILNSPSLVQAEATGVEMKAWRRMAAKFSLKPIERLTCAVFSDPDEAIKWIDLRHTGQNKGAGLVEWDGIQTARFRARSGRRSMVLDVLDYMAEDGYSIPKKFPISVLERLLGDGIIRSKLSIAQVNGRLVAEGDEDRTKAALLWMLGKIERKEVNTRNTNSADDKAKFAEQIGPDIAVTRSSGTRILAARDTVEEAVDETAEEEPAEKKKRAKRRPSKQIASSIVPADCVLKIGQDRANATFDEIARLPVESYPNAVGFLFRVFLELTVHEQLLQSGKTAEEVENLEPLSNRLKISATSLVSQGLITDGMRIAIEGVADSRSRSHVNTTRMNQFVHNPFAFPSPLELRNYWTEMQPYFQAVWR